MSNVHMAWARAVCGRIKSDYRYSKDVVYNNFPWPAPTEEQKIKIEQTAQAILDARDTYNKFISGEVIPTPPSPFQRAGRALTGVIRP